MHLSKAEAHTGAMVALYPPPELANALAQPGGEPADELHVTLAYLGPAVNIEEPDRLKQAVAEFAARTAPISGHISGTGKFTAGPTPVTYASVDLPTLSVARERLIYDLSRTAWLEPSREHGFQPHVTLAFDDRNVTVDNLPVTFDTVTLRLGSDRIDYPLSGATAEWIVPLWKAEGGEGEEPMLVYGVVLQPGIPDSQGDTLTAAEIEKACHRYMIESRKSDVQHNERAALVDVVECFIAPMDIVVADRPVIKGAWVLGSSVRDPVIKADVRAGRLTGYSIGGTGFRS